MDQKLTSTSCKIVDDGIDPIFEPLNGRDFSVMLLTENKLIGSPTEADA